MFMPLPRLADLAINQCNGAYLDWQGLCLPQLTSLQLPTQGSPTLFRGFSPPSRPAGAVHMWCHAFPALARLTRGTCTLSVADSFAALKHLTQLQLRYERLTHLEGDTALLCAAAASLRRLGIEIVPKLNEQLAGRAGEVAATAGLERLTRLVRSARTCFTCLLLVVCCDAERKCSTAASLHPNCMFLTAIYSCTSFRPPSLTPPLPTFHLPARSSTVWPAWSICPPGPACKSCCCPVCTRQTSMLGIWRCWLRRPACGGWPSDASLAAQTMLPSMQRGPACRCATRLMAGQCSKVCC